MLKAVFQYEFLQNAVLSALLASIVCGIIGVIIVEKKLVMMSGGIAHTSYGGVGLAYLLGFEPVYGAFIFSVSAAAGLGIFKRKGKTGSDAIIGMFWSLGMALGIIFIALMNGYPPNLTAYLFGNILSVTDADLLIFAVLTAVIVLSVILFFNHWKAYLFDEEFISVIGVKKSFLEFCLLILIALSIVVLLRVAGIVLVIALLTAPAATAGIFSGSLKLRMLISAGLGIVYCFSGLILSYYLSLPTGAASAVLAVLVYLIVFFIRAAITKIRISRYKRSANE